MTKMQNHLAGRKGARNHFNADFSHENIEHEYFINGEIKPPRKGKYERLRRGRKAREMVRGKRSD